MKLKASLRLLAILTLLGGSALWLATGAHRGWTKTSVPVKFVDEVTGIEGVNYQRKFVPGYDFLIAICAVSLVFRGAAFFVRDKKPPKSRDL